MASTESERKAVHHKLSGNCFFKSKDYTAASKEYSKAIICDPLNPVYFTNRALCFYLCKDYESTEIDCMRAIELLKDLGFDTNTNQDLITAGTGTSKIMLSSLFKAHFYLGMSLYSEKKFKSALKPLKGAKQLGKTFNDPKLPLIVDHIKMCEHMVALDSYNREKINQTQLRSHLVELLRKDLDASCERERLHCPEEYDTLETKYESDITSLNEIFDEVDKLRKMKITDSHNSLFEEEPPDYLIDPISFDIYKDPVITPTGQTYERASLLKYLETNHIDPISKKPLHVRDLVPNIAIRNAVEAFFKKMKENET